MIDALLLVAPDERTYGEIYNLGADEIVSLLEFTELLIELAGKGRYRIVPFPEESKKIDIGDYYGSFEKIRTEIGWSPKVTLEEGIRRTLAYYRDRLEPYLT